LETPNGSALRLRFERVYNELLYYLSTEEMRIHKALPPLKDDLRALEHLDPSFVRELDITPQKKLKEEEEERRGESSPKIIPK